ncbi:MAG: class I SAM-dependent methyltransferase [Pseudomonadales bacterium]
MRTWFASPAGAGVLAEEVQVLTGIVRRVHGDALLWLGCDQGLDTVVRGTMVRHRIVGALPAVEIDTEQPVIRCVPDELPFANGSMDAVVLRHALETAEDPRTVLREAARVIAPGGRLVIATFNPVSLWGLRRLYAGAVPDAFRGLKLIAPYRLIDWLTLLGFDLAAASPDYRAYGLPFSDRSKDRLELRHNAFERWLIRRRVPFGGIMFVAATKRAFAGRMQRERVTRLASPPFGRPAYNRGNVIKLPVSHSRRGRSD